MSHPAFTWKGQPSTTGPSLRRTEAAKPKTLPTQITFGKANFTTSINTERHRVVRTSKAAI